MANLTHIISSIVNTVQFNMGKINSPVKAAEGNTPQVVGGILSTFFTLFMTIASLSAFGYLLWGVYDWITSGGESDKLSKAQQKMVQAIIGIIVLIIAIAFYFTFMGGLSSFKIPQFNPAGAPGGGGIPQPPTCVPGQPC